MNIKQRKSLTDDGNTFFIYDSTGQQMEVELLAIHHNRMASIVTALQNK